MSVSLERGAQNTNNTDTIITADQELSSIEKDEERLQALRHELAGLAKNADDSDWVTLRHEAVCRRQLGALIRKLDAESRNSSDV